MANSENIQFFEQSNIVKEETWGGAENKVSSIAFKVPEGIDLENIEYTHVLKEPRGLNYFESLAERFSPQNETEEQAVQKLSEYFNSREHFMNSGKDYRLMKKVFGDLLPDTQYIIGEPRKGNELGFYILQKRINGKTWTEFTKDRSPEQNKEYMMQHRDQLIDLIGGARKVLIEIGASVDIWGDNIMVDEKGNFVLIDPGSPSELERHFSDLTSLPKEMRSLLANNLLKRATDLKGYPNAVEMTNEEIEKMNEKFGFTQEQYEQATSRLVSRCEMLAG
jgi:hypothetical protein